MLYEMTFSQLLTLVETRNAREKRAHEAAEERAAQQNTDRNAYIPPKAVSELPSTQDIQRVFGAAMR
jgi:hypothetical protein